MGTQATHRSSRAVTKEELAKLNQELRSATWESKAWPECEGDSTSAAAPDEFLPRDQVHRA
jgi:hypothetical protein